MVNIENVLKVKQIKKEEIESEEGVEEKFVLSAEADDLKLKLTSGEPFLMIKAGDAIKLVVVSTQEKLDGGE